MTVDGIGFTVTASGSSSGTVSGDPFSLPDDNTDPRNPTQMEPANPEPASNPGSRKRRDDDDLEDQ